MKILTDIHTHTIASGHAYSTLKENLEAAKEKGLEAICISDHFGEIPDSAHPWHFLNLKTLPMYEMGIRVLRGAEANILDINGNIDLTEDVAKNLDIVIASIHTPCYKDTECEDHTEAYMNVVKNPMVDIIGHSGSVQYPYDYERVVIEARDNGKLIELNAGTFRSGRKAAKPNCIKIAELCKKHSVGVCVNSDAHFYTHIGSYDEVVKMLHEIDFPTELIMNRSLKVLRDFMAPRKNIEI